MRLVSSASSEPPPLPSGAIPAGSTTAPDHLLLLAEVGRELTAGGQLKQQLERAMQVLERRLGARAALLCLADEGQRTLEIEAAYGVPAQAFRCGYGQGVAGRVAMSGRSIAVPLARLEPMAVSELPELVHAATPAQCLACVPLFMAGRSAGALSVYFGAEARGDLIGRVSVLEVVSSLFSQALRTARLESLAEREHASDAGARTVFEFANMIGASPAIRQVYEQIAQVAPTNATVLIRGESGTGKELVAQAIHTNSPRANQPFVSVNCAALPETLFESELFGHERGAFTGAHARKKGRFELAQGGTLFLDEIGELPLTTQAKLLRVLQFREFERLGGTETLRTDIRLVAATNKDIQRAVATASFREDLFYRLNVFSITLPPLRDRRADITALAEYFLARFASEHHRRCSRISSGALEILTAYAWPGNVRELENVIERAVVVCDGVVVKERHLPDATKSITEQFPRESLTLKEAVARLERSMIEEALRKAHGNATRAARALGTTERIVRYRAQKYGIDSSGKE